MHQRYATKAAYNTRGHQGVVLRGIPYVKISARKDVRTLKANSYLTEVYTDKLLPSGGQETAEMEAVSSALGNHSARLNCEHNASLAEKR